VRKNEQTDRELWRLAAWLASCSGKKAENALPACAKWLLLSGLLWISPPALAEDSGDSLAITLAEGCPSEAHFRERLRVLAAGRPLISRGRVELSREAGGYRLRVQTRDASRTLWNASCAKLVESAAVIVALGAAAEQASASSDVEQPSSASLPVGAQSDAQANPQDPQTQAAASAAAGPVAQQNINDKPSDGQATHPSEAPAKRRRQPYLAGWAELSGLWGVVPGITVRPAIGMRVRGARLGGALSVDYALPRSSGAEGVRVHGPGASLLLSAVLHERVHAALGPDLHLLWGQGRGVEHVQTAMIPLWAGRLELELVPWMRGATRLGIVLSGALAIDRHAFVFGDGGTAYRPRPYQLLGGLRLTFERKRR
jgi:hypothetical protein